MKKPSDSVFLVFFFLLLVVIFPLLVVIFLPILVLFFLFLFLVGLLLLILFFFVFYFLPLLIILFLVFLVFLVFFVVIFFIVEVVVFIVFVFVIIEVVIFVFSLVIDLAACHKAAAAIHPTTLTGSCALKQVFAGEEFGQLAPGEHLGSRYTRYVPATLSNRHGKNLLGISDRRPCHPVEFST